MPANSFQNAICPDGKYAVPAGELHLLDETDRHTDWDISVNPTTAWVEHDLSARVPKGTKALFCAIGIHSADATCVLLIRDGTSAETDVVRTHTFSHSVGVDNVIFWPTIIKATDGIFAIKEQLNTLEVTVFYVELWGYFL